MKYSLREAAAEVKCSRSTIHRAIEKGKISAQRDESGAYRIDPSELFRVFQRTVPETSHRDTMEQGRDGLGDSVELLSMKVEMLEAQLEREREAVRREQETVEDLRTRLDKAEERVFALAAPQVRSQNNTGPWSWLKTWRTK